MKVGGVEGGVVEGRGWRCVCVGVGGGKGLFGLDCDFQTY